MPCDCSRLVSVRLGRAGETLVLARDVCPSYWFVRDHRYVGWNVHEAMGHSVIVVDFLSGEINCVADEAGEAWFAIRFRLIVLHKK